MEVRFTVDADYMEELKQALGVRTATEVAQEALTILKWAIEERQRGKQILSADSNGTDLHRLVTPRLQRVGGAAR
ncbi:MAG TPA: hypothetical protein VD962_10980 [Rubricoccaceae bacterium]|nr:hypothetical protein [Rubricoccaceae bacterium]